jgi:RNA polymerase sigma-70 factor (ECF subfamily)
MTHRTGEADALLATISLASAGDETAFAQIVQAHHHAMVGVCFLITSDLDAADEAVQAAWAIAWRKLEGLREPARLRSWLVSVAANEARQLMRRRRRRSVVELAVDGVEAVGGDPSTRVRDLDLVNALARLDPEDRALLALRYVAGFDSFELAGATGRSPSGTRARLARLLARLRSELGDD